MRVSHKWCEPSGTEALGGGGGGGVLSPQRGPGRIPGNIFEISTAKMQFGGSSEAFP